MKKKTFNSLYGIHVAYASDPKRIKKTFNSLYGILIPSTALVRGISVFQFPLWDTQS